MKLTKTVWAAVMATALAATSLTAHAQSRKELVQKLVAVQQASLEATARGLTEAPARQLVAAWIAPQKGLADRLMQPMGAFDRQGGWSLAKLVLLGDAVREFVYASRAAASG